MIVKYITHKIMNNDYWSYDALRSLKDGEYEFMKVMLDNVHGDRTFIPASCKDTMCAKLNISHATFWRRVERLMNLKILVKTHHGIYDMNSKWIRLVTIDTEAQKRKNKLKGDTQHATHSRF